MARAINYDAARQLLANTFLLAEEDFRDKVKIGMPDGVATATNRLFKSKTQAYREALVGCAIVASVDSNIDIRNPIAGENAFSGRTLDEQVVNPFFQDRAVPVSKAPYLSAIRRGVKFIPGGATGQKDSEAFDALVSLVDFLRSTNEEGAAQYLRFLLGKFVELRDSANIPLRKIGRLSLEQYGQIIDGLLKAPSGGRMPVLLSVAMFHTIKDFYSLDWTIDHQGINVADAVSGAGGDITVFRNDQIVLVVEVTERPISRERVTATFNTKISPNNLDDYLFFHTANQPTDTARTAAAKYFAQGHDINFVSIKDWIVTTLTTIGPKGRSAFTQHCVGFLSEKGVPATVKQTWNDQVSAVAEN